MRKVIALCLMLCCMFSLCACSKDEIVEQYNEALQAVGDNNLTDNKDLQGTRELGEDSYVGTYQADYDDFTGKEIVFGGTSLERDAVYGFATQEENLDIFLNKMKTYT